MYIINLILVFRLLLVYSLFHRLPPSSLSTSVVASAQVRRNRNVPSRSHARHARAPCLCLPYDLPSLSLSLPSSSLHSLRSLRSTALILERSRPSPSADIHRFSVSVVLPAGSESVHKRVINYLRVGHVFPPCSPTSTSFSLSLPLSFSAPTIEPRPAAFSVSTRHDVSFVTLSRFRTRCPRAHSVCTHALMLIRLNAPKASRGSRARFQKLRPITNRDPRGGHGRPRGK